MKTFINQGIRNSSRSEDIREATNTRNYCGTIESTLVPSTPKTSQHENKNPITKIGQQVLGQKGMVAGLVHKIQMLHSTSNGESGRRKYGRKIRMREDEAR